MDRQQIALLIAFSVVFMAALGGAYWYASNQAQTPTAAAGERGFRFEARPGTTREQAVALSTNKRDAPTMAPRSGAAEGRGDSRDPLRVRSLSAPETEAASQAEAVARAARNLLSPRDGIARVQAALASARAPEDVAALYETLAQLYAELDEREAVRETWAAAREQLGEAWHARLALAEARTLLQWGEPVRALALVDEGLAQHGGPPSGVLGLHALRGQLLEQQGRIDEAIAAYNAALSAAETGRTTGAPNAVRHAAMQLARIHRHYGRDAEAAAAAQRYRDWHRAQPAAAE